MKILVLGSTGGTGRELVKQALERGHLVSAFARNPAKIEFTNENLAVVKGDITDIASIEKAVPGHDTVLSALGSPGLKKSTELSDGTRRVISIMEKVGIKRLIFESSVGIGDSRDYADRFGRWILFPLVIKHIFADKEIQERLIMESSLDWTIVRPARLTNGKRKGVYRKGDEINAQAISRSISRADAAEFMLAQLNDDTYLYKTPAVSY